jgi:hypothetical protein
MRAWPAREEMQVTDLPEALGARRVRLGNDLLFV